MSDDRAYRYGWVLAAVALLAVVGVTLWLRSSAPTYVAQNPLTCVILVAIAAVCVAFRPRR